MTSPPNSPRADGQEARPGEPVVVRTREVLFERSRSAKAPRRVFGPGFLARLREKQALSWIRFRHPIVTWVSLPAFLGESLEGRISFARPLRLSGPPQLTLRCVHEEVDRSGGTEQRKLFRVYSQTQSLLLAGDKPVDYLDFAFELPDPGGSQGTDLHANEPVYWQLLVKVPVAGPDLEAGFLAPVYRKLTAKKKG